MCVTCTLPALPVPVPSCLRAAPSRPRQLAAEAAAFGEHPADRLARVLTVLDDAALEMRGASDVRLVLEIGLHAPGTSRGRFND